MQEDNQKIAEVKKWVQLYSDTLFTWAYHKTSDKAVAEDLVQDTFLAALESFEKFQGKSSHKTWLFGILNHKIVDYYRKLPTLETNVGDFFVLDGHWDSKQAPKPFVEGETELLDDENFRIILFACLKKLPQKFYMCVASAYLEEKDSTEICQELEISATNYWQILHRAKLQLRKCIEFNGFHK